VCTAHCTWLTLRTSTSCLSTQRTQVSRPRTTAVNWLVLFKTLCFYYEKETEFANIVEMNFILPVFCSRTEPTARHLASRNFDTRLSFKYCPCIRLTIHRTVSLFRFSVTLSPVAPSPSLFHLFALCHTLSSLTLGMKVTDFVWTALSKRKQTRYLRARTLSQSLQVINLPVTTHLTQRRSQIARPLRLRESRVQIYARIAVIHTVFLVIHRPYCQKLE